MRRGFVLFARIEAFCSAVIVKQPSSDNTPYEKIGDEVRSLADEVPFDIPDSWEWCRFSSLITLLSPYSFFMDRRYLHFLLFVIEHKHMVDMITPIFL